MSLCQSSFVIMSLRCKPVVIGHDFFWYCYFYQYFKFGMMVCARSFVMLLFVLFCFGWLVGGWVGWMLIGWLPGLNHYVEAKGERSKRQHSNLFTVANLLLVINFVDKPNIIFHSPSTQQNSFFRN